MNNDNCQKKLKFTFVAQVQSAQPVSECNNGTDRHLYTSTIIDDYLVTY